MHPIASPPETDEVLLGYAKFPRRRVRREFAGWQGSSMTARQRGGRVW